MNWVGAIVEESCVGMVVTSYDPADLSVEFGDSFRVASSDPSLTAAMRVSVPLFY